MKKKIFGGIVLVAIAVAVAFNVSISNQKQDKASMLALANVEVLAEAEEFTVTCGRTEGHCWIDLGMLKFCGEYSYFDCIRSEEPSNYCVRPSC